ncbi:MAG: hypothetical protein M3463_13040 [Verrucomicrobiota bacterium]|nr:hypothetical protein [Verrucomicrobiota bacterium]
MKPVVVTLLLAGTSLLVIGCESDLPPEPTAPTAAKKLERGIRGQGTLTEANRSEGPFDRSDPFVRESSRSRY